MCLTLRVPAVGILALSISTIAMPGLAQVGATTADLSGVVVDQLRAVVPGVAVTATNDATGLERSAVTGADGRYVIPALPPGTYSITVAFTCFTSNRAENIRLALGEATVLDFELEVAARPEAVTVVGEPLVGARRQGSVATVVSQHEIESLPANGRNFSTVIGQPLGSIDQLGQTGAVPIIWMCHADDLELHGVAITLSTP